MATIRGKRDVRLAALAALLMLAGAVRPAAMPARVAARASTAPSPIPGATAAPVENRVNDTYGSLPLVFVPNGGRTNSQVSFWAQAGGARFYFTPSEAVFAFTKDDRGLALRLSFINANPAPQIVGTRPGPGKVNYLVGSDRGSGTQASRLMGRSSIATSGLESTSHFAATAASSITSFTSLPGPIQATSAWHTEALIGFRLAQVGSFSSTPGSASCATARP